MRLIGAHVSTAGGLLKGIEKAGGLGANAMQIFTGSPRIWKGKSASDFEVKRLAEAREKFGIKYSIIHATYLINLASEKPELVEKSRMSLVNDLKIAAKGGFGGVVVHLGSHMGKGYEAVKKQVALEISKILAETPDESVFLIENSAGQKGKIASDLEEIAELLSMVNNPRLAWCLDTCHAHAAGYRLVESGRIGVGQAELFEEKAKSLVAEIERLRLWKSLACVHVNESRDTFGSGRDRHANLGEGEIGDEVLREFLTIKKLKDLPLILEVPGFDKKGPDKENVLLLKKLVLG